MTARLFLALLLVSTLAVCGNPSAAQEAPAADAIVVGAGLSGLSAAIEMGRAGVNVLVVDMNSVAGGHAVLAGGVALVGTPVQEKAASGIPRTSPTATGWNGPGTAIPGGRGTTPRIRGR